tara:strand:+ start:2148 stop:2447 length:300 start_codon:yes stop_codon:yes gene_type:complete
MGKINNHKNVINELVMKTKDFANQERRKKMNRKLEVFSVVWKNNLNEIINDVEYGYDEEQAISRIKQSAGFDSILYIDKFPLSLKSMKLRKKLTGVEPS